MENNPKRPPSVWITQLLLLLPFVLLAFRLTVNLLRLDLNLRRDVSGSIISISYELVLSTLFFVALIGMARRENYGRWLGVACLTLNCIFGVYTVVSILLDPDIQSKFISKETMTIAAGIQFALILFLISRLAFGSAANAFFAKPDTTE